jgi:hypothetical protein
LPVQSSGAGGVCSPMFGHHHGQLGFHPPASLAERWMR